MVKRVEDPETFAAVAPKAQREILIHAVFSGLTPLIPLPLVDDWAHKSIQQRMVKKIAEVHSTRLYEADAEKLGSETGRNGGFVYSAAKKLAFYPVIKLFRTALFVLIVKDIVEVASRTYHVGYLLDYAIGQAWQSTASPEALRTAIDDVCRHADTSPVRRAFLSVFEESRDLLDDTLNALRRWLSATQLQSDVDSASTQRPREVESIADRLQKAINVLPPQHFLHLRKELGRALGVNVT